MDILVRELIWILEESKNSSYKDEWIDAWSKLPNDLELFLSELGVTVDKVFVITYKSIDSYSLLLLPPNLLGVSDNDCVYLQGVGDGAEVTNRGNFSTGLSYRYRVDLLKQMVANDELSLINTDLVLEYLNNLPLNAPIVFKALSNYLGEVI